MTSRRDGTPFMNLLTLAPLIDSRGDLRYYIGAQVDVSALVMEGTGLEALRRMRRRERKQGGEGGEEEKDELRELCEMFTSAELETVRRFGGRMHQETLADGGDDEGVYPRLARVLSRGSSSITDEYRTQDRDSSEEWIHDGRLGGPYEHVSHTLHPSFFGSIPLGRRSAAPMLKWTFSFLSIPCHFIRCAEGNKGFSSFRSLSILLFLSHETNYYPPQYILIRPSPSLRILFTSPSLAAPGILQSRFLDRIGGSMRVRNSLAQALAEGTRGVTAKVRWLDRPGGDEGEEEGGFEEPGREREGRPRWIHCTPLLGATGVVGVWMVILVDVDVDDEMESRSQSRSLSLSSRNGIRNASSTRASLRSRSAAHGIANPKLRPAPPVADDIHSLLTLPSPRTSRTRHSYIDTTPSRSPVQLNGFDGHHRDRDPLSDLMNDISGSGSGAENGGIGIESDDVFDVDVDVDVQRRAKRLSLPLLNGKIEGVGKLRLRRPGSAVSEARVGDRDRGRERLGGGGRETQRVVSEGRGRGRVRSLVLG